MNELEQVLACGGTRRLTGGDAVLDFGFRRDPAFTAAAIAEGLIVATDPTEQVPRFAEDQIFLWGAARLLNGGKHPAYNWQLTGSCVNGGGQNALLTRIAVEIARGRQARERFVRPFTLFAYGLSRWLGFQDDSEGEGSLGDAFVRALAMGTVLPADVPQLPQAVECGPAFCYSRDEELRYSARRNAPPELMASARQFPCKFGVVQSAEAAEDELRKGRPLTWAGDWGGNIRCRVVDGVLLNERAGTWQHQQACLGFWRHPRLGKLFWIHNQWYGLGPGMEADWINTRDGRQIRRITKPGEAVPLHGQPTNGEPPGGYWIRAEEMEYQCRRGEVRSLVELDGFADALVDWGTV